MGPKDITQIMGFAAPSKVKRLCKDECSELDISEIQKLARCLLVSEDVLTCGKGLRYGNWNNAFAGDGLKVLKKNCGTKSKPKTMEQWRNDVKTLINVSSEEFEAMIDQHPEFFRREPFCLYDIYDEEDGVVYTDCREMIADALHPEEAEILLTVLKDHDRT